MKKCIIFILLTLFLIAPFQQISAHAGVLKKSGDIFVTFYQSPLSPLVGEEVKITFVVTDTEYKPHENLHGTLKLIDTFYGDESKDKIILTKPFITDANGASELVYTFTKQNFFSLELQFAGYEEKWQHIDYLIQPRQAGLPIIETKKTEKNNNIAAFLLGAVMTLGIMRILQINRTTSPKRKNSTHKKQQETTEL